MSSRVSIRPSVLGTKGMLLFCALELAFLATNYSNLFFLLLAFSAVLGALGAFWAYRNLRNLGTIGVEAGMAATGCTRALRLALAPDGGKHKKVRFDLRFELLLDAWERHERQGHPGTPARPCYREVAYTPCMADNSEPQVVAGSLVVGSLPGQPRGIRELTALRVTSRFPFGFFEARVEVPITLELVTHPTPTAVANGRASTSPGGDDADRGALLAGRGATLSGLRSFRPGDAVADVHWKATARRGAPVVKERERESNPIIEVVLDRRCDETTFESALSETSTLVLAARHGAPVRLVSQDFELLIAPEQPRVAATEDSVEHRSTTEALRWLASAEPLADDAAPPPARRAAVRLPSGAVGSVGSRGAVGAVGAAGTGVTP